MENNWKLNKLKKIKCNKKVHFKISAYIPLKLKNHYNKKMALTNNYNKKWYKAKKGQIS